jgi:hypothetical protein
LHFARRSSAKEASISAALCIEHHGLVSKFWCASFRVRLLGRSIGVIRVHQQGDALYAGHHLMEELHTLCAGPFDRFDQKASYRLRSDNLCIAGFDCRARLLRCFAIALP